MRAFLAWSASCFLLTMVIQARAETPQISEGVRAMMFVEKGARFGPDDAHYLLLPQPPIDDYLPQGAEHFFSTGEQLIGFFLNFPPPVQGRGLWVTRALSPDGDTEEDLQRIAQLVAQASRKSLLLYICDPVSTDESDLVGWECAQRSPRKSEQLVYCAPRAEPHLGHPWWDCLIKS